MTSSSVMPLGDQMQLAQPIQGVHPGESGLSSLDYLLQGESTIAADRGIFLHDSWRMHPQVCDFISAAVYNGRLAARPENAGQVLQLTLDAHPLLKASGIVFAPVVHDGCSQRSVEEAELIAALVASLLTQRYVDKRGVEHPITLDSIRVVAPYDAQVNTLKRALPDGARVVTVDKFQGQEAELVLVSMTTSSVEYLPRDIALLFNWNRLNVAISRAKSLAVVVASPKLLDVPGRTGEEMALVNGVCWVRECGRAGRSR